MILSEIKLSRSQAVAMLVVTATLWSLGGLFIKIVPWHPLAIAGTRSAIAALLFLALIRRPRWQGSVAQIGGAVAYTVTVISFVAATKLTTAANAILLQYTAPVYVAILGAIILKEKTRLYDWFTVIVVMGGMALFFMDELMPGHLAGNLLSILSGLSFALMVICLRLQKNESPLESVLLGNILTALVGLPFILAQPVLSLAGWGAIVVLGVFQLGLSYVLYTVAIKFVTALDGILIPVVEPILNPVWVLLFLGEAPGPWALAGGLIVLVAVTVRCLLPSGHAGQSAENNGPCQEIGL
jgi:drug/metabolite transporter (DMT)-like permease